MREWEKYAHQGRTWDRGVVYEGERGPGMRTATGWFYPLDPKPEEVAIVDIAVALGNVCRFGGNLPRFYSVAQHSVLVSRNVPEALAVQALLHDAAEAYVGDMIAPIKRAEGMASYRAIEDRIWEAIAARFDVPAKMAPEVKEADLRALYTEQRDLLPPDTSRGKPKLEPFPDPLQPWAPDVAPLFFLKRWETLTGEGGLCRQLELLQWSLPAC